ncbi:serine hydrolase domain-containing protein [Sphingobacterium pedocola]|uniref:Serine hydrolase n=1 Tax=Sphingobacterium pedocola TaxID=2082722 RepID=A0ABR9T3B0_9SPHI|nr:serine hydrolase [Sphingobacterium pedocola]MBE8719831.1 serine hydrolase [Sphingobacterium pedocola]
MKKLNLLALLLLTLSLSSCKIGRYIVYNFADINDHKKFPSRIISRGDSSFHFAVATEGYHPKKIDYREQSHDFDTFLAEHESVAFMIIHNDSIKYENYFRGYDQSSVVPSFSMAKSVTSILIGCAIDDGLIGSVDEPITKYIPELSKNGFDEVTIKHLLQMTSGLKFNEGYYNPFGEVATFYYGINLRKAIKKLKLKDTPGNKFEYVSGNSQLLGLVLERALVNKTISQYLEEKIWRPLGMEYDTSWSLDRKKNGLEKTFCCVNAVARDYAKIGRLYLHEGNWNGKQLVPTDWVKTSTKIDTIAGSASYYQYQWWLPSKSGDFMAQGILGQYIYVNPDKNLVIVRLGRKVGDVNWAKVFTTIADGY